jgi:hypothetical protein
MHDHFRWAFGYCAARGYDVPVAATPPTLWFDVGKPDQTGRFILGDVSGEAAAAAFAMIDASHIYVDIAAPRDAILPHVPPHWQVRDRARLGDHGRARPVRRAPWRHDAPARRRRRRPGALPTARLDAI